MKMHPLIPGLLATGLLASLPAGAGTPIRAETSEQFFTR